MKHPLYTLINFPFSTNETGTLTMFDYKNIPFEIRRVLTIQNIKSGGVRGGHTHHSTHQILVCIKGQCDIELDNSIEKKILTLNNPAQGVVLYPYVWHIMRNFRNDAAFLVFANTDYNEKDYIRSYDDFLKFVKKI